MCSAGVGVWIPNSHEIFPAAIAEHRNRTFGVIADYAIVHAVLIHRPGMDFGKAVGSGEAHGVCNLRIVPRADAGIIPPVETMSRVAAIAKSNALLQHRRLG